MNFKSLFLHKWHLTFYVCACMCGSGSNQCLLKTLSKEALFQHQVNTFWGNCPTSRKLLFPTFFLLVPTYRPSMMGLLRLPTEKEDTSPMQRCLSENTGGSPCTEAISSNHPMLPDTEGKLWSWLYCPPRKHAGPGPAALLPVQDSSSKLLHYFSMASWGLFMVLNFLQ